MMVKRLGFAYDSAKHIGIKAFISFDFNNGLFSINDTAAIGQRIAAFKDHPGQLSVDGKPFVSFFAGSGSQRFRCRGGCGCGHLLSS